MVTIKEIILKKLNRIDPTKELARLYEVKKLEEHTDYQSNLPLWLKTAQFETLLKEERHRGFGEWGSDREYYSEPVHHYLAQMAESQDKDLDFFCELLLENYSELYSSIPNHLKTDDLKWCFLERNYENILKIEQPTEEMWAHALRQKGELIEHLNEPSVKLQKIVVRSNREAIRFIKNPCDEVKKIALLEDKVGWLDLKYINDSSLNELAIVLNPTRIQSIKTPSIKLETIALIVENAWDPFLSGNEEVLKLLPFLREEVLDREELNGRYENEKMLTLLAREKEYPSDTLSNLYFLEYKVSEEALSYLIDEKNITSFIKTPKKLPFLIQCYFYQRTFSVGEWPNPYEVEIISTSLTSFMKEIESKATDKSTMEKVLEPFLKHQHLTPESQMQLIDYLSDYPYDFIRLPNRLKTPFICRLMTAKIDDLKLFSPYHFEDWLAEHNTKEMDLKLKITEDYGLPF